jgi:hypothetical protein
MKTQKKPLKRRTMEKDGRVRLGMYKTRLKVYKTRLEVYRVRLEAYSENGSHFFLVRMRIVLNSTNVL